jgi:hypothetical protein
VPVDLVRAVNHAYTILSWQENLTSEEVPPEWMWSLDDELEEWFEEVAAARKARFGGGASSNGSEPDEAPQMMSNQLAERRKRR